MDPEEYHGEGDVFRLLWGRDFRAANALAFAKLVAAQALHHRSRAVYRRFSCPQPDANHSRLLHERAAYLILPTDRELSQAEMVARIQMLG